MIPDGPDPFPWLELLGRTHPVVLHLPLGLLPAIALLEFGALLLRRPPPRGAILTLSWLCAVSAALAVTSGLLLADGGDYGGATTANHKITGVLLGVLCLATAVAACFAHRAYFRFLLALACAVMVPTGHLGGSLTHGANFLLEPLAPKKAPRMPAGGVDDGPPTNGDPAEGPGAGAPSAFERVILPIFERTCTDCHNPDKKKAELLLTSAEGLQNGSEYGPVVVPGKPDESELLIRLLLPIDDEDHMPPDDKPQPTKEEIEALRAWIAAGARYD